MFFKQKAKKVTPQQQVLKSFAELRILERMGHYDPNQAIRENCLKLGFTPFDDEPTLTLMARTIGLKTDGLVAFVDGIFAGVDFAAYPTLDLRKKSLSFLAGIAAVKLLIENERTALSAENQAG